MPRDKGQDHIVPMPYPISGEEVEAMFRAPPSKPPYPTAETCKHLATFLSGNMPQHAEKIASISRAYQPTDAELRYRARWQDAVRTLRDTAGHPGSFPHALPGTLDLATQTLIRALDHAEQLLHARPYTHPHPQLKPWAVTGALTVMLGQAILQDLANTKVGASENSRAARFAELAIERIGWRDANGRPITRGALAKYHQKLMPDD